ncbi:MAG TPA: hypothetical protein VGD79_12995 [Thermoanaerobaculia bacterium]|jgi:hypothetical protein
MSEDDFATPERVCITCGNTDDQARLEQCHICYRFFCADCAHRAGFGRRFCSTECGRAYYFTGEPDDDEDLESDD